MTLDLNAETFQLHIGKTFTVSGAAHALTLRSVDRREVQPSEAATLAREPFTLLFSAPPGPVLVEGIHTLELADGAAATLYVMPIHTPDPHRQDYQSVFN
ncbi:hypothetical protein BH10PSE4_BH10PSE4_12210 [soil metagenome]